MNRAIFVQASRVVGWLFVGLGTAGVALAVVVLLLTAVSSAGTDDPTTYVMLLIVAATQLLLGGAILWVAAGEPDNRP